MTTAGILYDEWSARDLDAVSLTGDSTVVVSGLFGALGLIEVLESLGIGPNCTMEREQFEWMVKAASL